MDRLITFQATTATGAERPLGRRALTAGETPDLAAEAHAKLTAARAAEDTARRRTVRDEVPDTVTVRADLRAGAHLVDSDTAHA